MKFKYDTSTDEGKIAVMQEFARTKKGPLAKMREGDDEWEDINPPSWNWMQCDYNYPIEPKLVPWTINTIPKIGVIFRHEDGSIYIIGAYLGSSNVVRFAGFNGTVGNVSYETLLTSYEHSFDGQNWLPCGTEKQT